MFSRIAHSLHLKVFKQVFVQLFSSNLYSTKDPLKTYRNNKFINIAATLVTLQCQLQGICNHFLVFLSNLFEPEQLEDLNSLESTVPKT